MMTLAFKPAVSYPVGLQPLGVATADFNGDTKPDIVVTNNGLGSSFPGNTVSVLLNNGDGTFAMQVTYLVDSAPQGVATTDFNGDAKQDIVTANFYADTVSILLGYGNGSFAAQLTYSVDTQPREVAIADFNGDAKPDIVTTSWGGNTGNTVSVLLGYGNGSFAEQTSYLVGGIGPYGVDTADFNGDGKLDIVTANYNANSVSVLLGYGNGSFAAQTTYPVVSQPMSVAAADFNGDAKPDIVTTNSGLPGTISILLGYGNGSFAPQLTHPVGPWPNGIAIADFNGDTKQDVVTSNSNTVSVLLGYGHGRFAAQVPYSVSLWPCGVATADFNGDAKPDIVTVNHVDANNAGTVSVLINDTPTPTLTLTSIPTSASTLSATLTLTPTATITAEPKPTASITSTATQTHLASTTASSTPTQTATITAEPKPTASITSTATQTHLASTTASSTPTQTATITAEPKPITSITSTITQTALAYNKLIPINHTYYPSGRINIISRFSFSDNTIDMRAYPGVTYASLYFEQMGNDTTIHFTYQAFFLFSASLPPGQMLTKNHFIFSILTQKQGWSIQSIYLLVISDNDTNIGSFDPSQNKIDLSHYNISSQDITIISIGNSTSVQFNYREQAQIVVDNTTASDFKPSHFIFVVPPPESGTDQFIKWAKTIIGPVISVLSTAFGCYLRRGLLKNILYASNCWKGDRYIKETVWVPDDEDERRELSDRHGQPISMRDIDNIKLFTIFEESSSLLTCILPNYHILHKQSELIDRKLVITYPISGRAWIKLHTDTLNEEAIDSFFVQIIAKSGEILEQFKCSLENIKSEVFNLDMSAAPIEEACVSDSEVTTVSGTDPSNTLFSSVYYLQIQWTNPILQNYPLLQLADYVGGPVAVGRLIEMGANSHLYVEFEYLEQTMGTQKAIETLLLSDEQPHPASGAQFSLAIHSNLFWVGTIAYRLPVAYDQTKYLLKTAGLDLQEFYDDQGLETFVNPIGSILRPSLLLGGATLAYCTSSDPLVLLVAANQPGFSSNSDLLSNSIHYLTTIFSFARAYASPSAYTLPLVALQGTNLVSHLLVDTGLVGEDHYLMQWMQLATGLASETLGLFLYPDLPIKALQGISLLAQSLHCAELAWENIASYHLLYTETNENLDIPQTQDIQLQEDTLF